MAGAWSTRCGRGGCWRLEGILLKRGPTVCGNGIYAPVDLLDAALLEGIEASVLCPAAVRYLLAQATRAVRRTLAEQPDHLTLLRQQRVQVERELGRLATAIAEGGSTPVRTLVDQIQQREAKWASLEREIALVEERAGLGQLDVARAVRELTPVLAGWRESFRGNPVPAREIFRKLIVGPIVMEPLPAFQGYRWRGQLNGGAVLEGAQRYPMCLGEGTHEGEGVRWHWPTDPGAGL